MNFKGKVAVAFGLASAILITVCALSYRDVLRTARDQEWVAHTHFVREELEELLADLEQSQASERDYLLSGQGTYLSAFNAAAARVAEHTQNARILTADNPVQLTSLDQLEPLTAKRFAQMRAVIAERRARGLGAAIATEQSNHSISVMGNISAIIDTMLREENRLLGARAAAANANSHHMRRILLFGYAVAFLFLFIESVVIHKEMGRRQEAERATEKRSAELEAANKELEAFCYSVSHDLRSPLRGIDGFSQALLEDYSGKLDETGQGFLRRIRAGSQRMSTLIDDLLNLSRYTRVEMRREATDLSEIGSSVMEELRMQQPARQVEFVIAPRLRSESDPRLMRVVLENLLGNAWKFTSKKEHARIEFGKTDDNGSSAFYVKDNGAGFDPAYTARLFGAFQRLHGASEFPGTGIGLASVQRIIHRHGGRIWAESAVNQGATFYFTL
jgi:signal transduction histidine kinase